MNITLLGHQDIASLHALDRVIRQLPEHEHAVLLSTAPASAGDSPLDELARLDAKLCDQFLAGEIAGAVTAPLGDEASGTLDDPNSEKGLAVLADLQPDLIISIRYRRILRDAAIAVPRHGVLNLHSGILPDYRGVMATFWAMLNGEKEIGTTLHWIVDSGIDTGPVIGTCQRATQPGNSYLGNVLGLYAGGCDMMAAAVRDIAAGRPPCGETQEAAGNYFQSPGDADAKRFLAKGLTLVDGGEAAEICAGR